MTIRFHPEAELDFLEAALWYSNQKEDLDIEFVKMIDYSLERLAENPKQFPIIISEFRKIVVRKFPFTIIYTFDEIEIFVLAVFHTKQNPEKWLKSGTIK